MIVTDYMMPVMDGAVLLNALASDPELAKIPVVLVSARSAAVEVPAAELPA